MVLCHLSYFISLYGESAVWNARAFLTHKGLEKEQGILTPYWLGGKGAEHSQLPIGCVEKEDIPNFQLAG